MERCEKWKWHHRLETGDYAGAARDCTQALKMSDQAIPWSDDRMFFWHFLTSFGCVSSNFLILPRFCCHFPRHLSQLVPALVGGSVGTQGHCQAAPKGSARWQWQTWMRSSNVTNTTTRHGAHGGMTRFRPCLPRACATVDWQTATSQYKS